MRNQFNYFRNHGDEDGRREYTICYGDPDVEFDIVGAEDTEEEAKEACKRLNSVLRREVRRAIRRAKKRMKK